MLKKESLLFSNFTGIAINYLCASLARENSLVKPFKIEGHGQEVL
jgi:hypothetical protein